MKKLVLISCVGALCAAALAVHTVAQETKPGATVERKILEKHDQSGVPGKEIVVGTATFPPGAVIAYHTHPGDEAGYIMKGSVTLKTQGQPDRQLKAGDPFFNARGAVHSVIGGPDGGTVVSSWIVDKGVPMLTPVP